MGLEEIITSKGESLLEEIRSMFGSAENGENLKGNGSDIVYVRYHNVGGAETATVVKPEGTVKLVKAREIGGKPRLRVFRSTKGKAI